MTTSSAIVLVSAAACVLLFVGVSGQSTLLPSEQPNELNFRDSDQLSTSTTVQSPTAGTIDYDTKPQDQIYNNNNYQISSSTMSSLTDLNNGQQDFAPFRGGFGSGFGGTLDSFNGLHSMLQRIIGDSIGRQHQMFEQKFQDLERQAERGQDVSYFERNGVAYVRTCTTKRVQ